LLNDLAVILDERTTPLTADERRLLLAERLRAAGFRPDEVERIDRAAFPTHGG